MECSVSIRSASYLGPDHERVHRSLDVLAGLRGAADAGRVRVRRR